jgi:hypothetical protein
MEIRRYRKAYITHGYQSGIADISFTKRHPLDLLTQCPPIISLEFCIFHPLLAPVLMKLADMVLGMLEVVELVSNTLFDKDSSSMLVDNGLLILIEVSDYCTII